MSGRVVHSVDRITYTFTRKELLDLLLEHGEDNRGFNLNPSPRVEWTADGVTLVYEYANAKEEPLPLPVTALLESVKQVPCGHCRTSKVGVNVQTCGLCKAVAALSPPTG